MLPLIQELKIGATCPTLQYWIQLSKVKILATFVVHTFACHSTCTWLDLNTHSSFDAEIEMIYRKAE